MCNNTKAIIISLKMSCPVCTNNRAPFAQDAESCKYHPVEGHNLSNFPKGSHRIRKPYRISPVENEYLRYSVPNAQDALNTLIQDPHTASVFPRDIYDRYPMGNLSPSLEGFRDTTLLYTYVPDPMREPGSHLPCKERSIHTPLSSRFGYNRYPQTVEYGTGHQSRGYIEPAECHECANDTPKGMAPQKFYTEYHMRSTPTELRKMIHQEPTC
jgi:hypothetical protein